MYNHAVRAEVLIVVVLLAACAPQAASVTPPPKDLRPYLTITPSATQPASTSVVGAAETPLPSPTPFQYTVAAGDTLSQIAEKFNVSLDSLLAVNPGVDPNAMSVGSVLKIPSGQQNASGESTPTPVPLPVDQVACHPTSDRGAWCFVLIHNDSTDLVENVTGRLTLLDTTGKLLAGQTALLPLDILPSGQALPLSVYFPPDVPLDAKPQVQMLTAIRLLPGDRRYLSAAIGDTLVSVDWSGLNARVRGAVTLPADSRPAGEVWVAAVAYDAAGNVISVRRWESNAGLAAGGRLPFSFMISSIAGKIECVDFAVEARPQ
jgi:LysM repeat protein